MAIGKIVSLPPQNSPYAHVRDEYGNNYSVDKKEIPEDAKPGDDYAYYVDVNYHEKSLSTTIKQDRKFENPVYEKPK